MKTTTTLLLFSLFSTFGFSQDKAYDLLKDKTTTNILYDRVYNLSKANSLNTKTISATTYNQVYHEMQRADFSQSLPKYEVLKAEAQLGKVTKQVPLSVLITDFETIKNSAIENGDVYLNSNKNFALKPNTNAVFEKHSLNLMSALVANSSSSTFILKEDFVFNTTNRIISSISIKTENSNWRKITFGQPFQLSLNSSSGKQTIDYHIEFTNHKAIEQSFEIEINNEPTAEVNRNSYTLAPNAITPITATVGYQGFGETQAFVGQGEYELFLDTTTGVLDKPIFLVDGFDPGDSRNSTAIYQSLNYGAGQNLADDLRAQGFDVVILNFPVYTRPNTTTVIDGGADFIQRNAFILVELINQINAQKVGSEENVVIGPSMGGLISRYALRYMEMNSLDHQTRLYISFDSPHLGANVPIGFQHLFNYMAYGPLGNAQIQPIVDGLIKSPAARQMLIDHYEGHLQTGSAFEFNTASASLVPTGSPNYRDAFQNELNAMGFPTTVRNVSVSNGAGNGTSNYTPDFEVMNHTFNITASQRAIINLRFTPAANLTNQVSRFRGQTFIIVNWFTIFESLANSKAPTFTDGLDTAPGGRFDMSGFQAGLGADPLLTEFFDNLNADYFCFIPAWSSMAISSTNNLYAPITSSSVTPFVASSIPTVNENHVTVNAQNLAFMLNEILNPPLNSEENVALNSIWIKNPIAEVVEINSSYTIENASISITDVLGKTIFNSHNQTINGSLQIPVSLQNGVYLITIETASGSTTKKVIKS